MREDKLIEEVISIGQEIYRQGGEERSRELAKQIIALVQGSEWISMPKELTAENGAKDLFRGEFYTTRQAECMECCDKQEADEDCEICGGAGVTEIKSYISWTTIKEIYAMAVNHFSPPTNKGESNE